MLIGLIDEYASLFQHGKYVAQRLAEEDQKFRAAQKVFGDLATAVDLADRLSSLIDQLPQGVQNLANALSFIGGTLKNEAIFAEVTTPENAVLYLGALKTSLSTLAEEVK